MTNKIDAMVIVRDAISSIKEYHACEEDIFEDCRRAISDECWRDEADYTVDENGICHEYREEITWSFVCFSI